MLAELPVKSGLRSYGGLRTEVEKLKARRVSRFLKGSMVIFHKDSFYNQLVSRYRGEHDKMPADEFKRQISVLSQKMKGKTITDIRNSK